MSLYTVVTGGTIQAADIDQLVNTLQVPSGSTEAKTVLVIAGAFQTSATVGNWIGTVSQFNTAGSVTLSSTTLTGVGSITVSNISSSGANLNAAATGPSNTARFVTTATFNY